VIQLHRGSSPSPLQPGVPFEAIKRAGSLIASVWEGCDFPGQLAVPSQGNAGLLRDKRRNSAPGSWRAGAAEAAPGSSTVGAHGVGQSHPQHPVHGQDFPKLPRCGCREVSPV